MNAPKTFSSAFSVALANETATANLMADLALLIGPGDVITLTGDLGAGKTAAARAMIRYLADDDALEVPSPTFTLAQSYDHVILDAGSVPAMTSDGTTERLASFGPCAVLVAADPAAGATEAAQERLAAAGFAEVMLVAGGAQAAVAA